MGVIPIDFNKVWQAGTPDAFRIIEDNGVMHPPVSSSIYHSVNIQFIVPNSLGGYTILRDMVYHNITSGNRYIRDCYKFNMFFDGEKYNGAYGNRRTINQWYSGHLLRRIYDLWNAMMSRVYDYKDLLYPINKSKGVTVYYKWRIGEFFIADLPTIPGFDRWVNITRPYEMALDKDMMAGPDGVGHYVPGKVAFITFSENSLESAFRNNETMGVKLEPRTKNYVVTVNNKVYGQFYDKNAAMNQYNYVAKAQGRDDKFLYTLRPDQQMSIRETLNFKCYKNTGDKRQLFTVIDK